MYIAIVCSPDCDVINFEINLIFLIKPFFLQDQKDKTKNLTSSERKELLRWNKKDFSSLMKGYRWEFDFNFDSVITHVIRT